MADRVRQLLPDGVDAIFDLAGGATGLRAVVDLLADRQKLISAGDPETVEELGGHVIERDRPLDEAADAIAAVEVGHARGKVVIEAST